MLSWFKKLFKTNVEKRLIDDYEYNNLKTLMDEIYLENNFI